MNLLIALALIIGGSSNTTNKTTYLRASNESVLKVNQTSPYIKPTSVISVRPVPTPMYRKSKNKTREL